MGTPIAITIQEMVHIVVHAIAIVEKIAGVTKPLRIILNDNFGCIMETTAQKSGEYNRFQFSKFYDRRKEAAVQKRSDCKREDLLYHVFT